MKNLRSGVSLGSVLVGMGLLGIGLVVSTQLIRNQQRSVAAMDTRMTMGTIQATASMWVRSQAFRDGLVQQINAVDGGALAACLRGAGNNCPTYNGRSFDLAPAHYAGEAELYSRTWSTSGSPCLNPDDADCSFTNQVRFVTTCSGAKSCESLQVNMDTASKRATNIAPARWELPLTGRDLFTNAIRSVNSTCTEGEAPVGYDSETGRIVCATITAGCQGGQCAVAAEPECPPDKVLWSTSISDTTKSICVKPEWQPACKPFSASFAKKFSINVDRTYSKGCGRVRAVVIGGGGGGGGGCDKAKDGDGADPQGGGGGSGGEIATARFDIPETGSITISGVVGGGGLGGMSDKHKKNSGGGCVSHSAGANGGNSSVNIAGTAYSAGGGKGGSQGIYGQSSANGGAGGSPGGNKGGKGTRGGAPGSGGAAPAGGNFGKGGNGAGDSGVEGQAKRIAGSGAAGRVILYFEPDPE